MTIEERASICSHCLIDTTRSCHNDCTYYERYKAFLEQKAIDDKECESLINKACEVVRDLANEHFGDWEQSCKFENAFRNAMGAVAKESLTWHKTSREPQIMI